MYRKVFGNRDGRKERRKKEGEKLRREGGEEGGREGEPQIQSKEIAVDLCLTF